MTRSSSFSQAVADAICERLADGESLRSICADASMPNRSTVFRWLAEPDNTHLRDQYARARESQADAMADDILSIADEPLPSTDKGGIDAAAVQQQRLRVDARKWLAAKLQPKRYGERVQAEHCGPGGAPIQFERIERVIIDPASPAAT